MGHSTAPYPVPCSPCSAPCSVPASFLMPSSMPSPIPTHTPSPIPILINRPMLYPVSCPMPINSGPFQALVSNPASSPAPTMPHSLSRPPFRPQPQSNHGSRGHFLPWLQLHSICNPSPNAHEA